MTVSLVEVKDLKKWFPVKRSFLKGLRSRKAYTKAVDGVSFQIAKGEIFGLAGESGCGKTTTGRIILGFTKPTEGEVCYEGMNTFKIPKSERKRFRRNMQMIHQDPYESLNPRMSVSQTISEPITIHNLASDHAEKEELIIEALEQVDLKPPEQFLSSYPHELSGGQRQRVSIARSLVLGPHLIVADEPVSMIDASIRLGILNLMIRLNKEFDISYLFITHDLAVLRYISSRTAIMYLGQIVEVAPTERIIFDPIHPYTRALLKAIPVPDPDAKGIEVTIKGEVQSEFDRGTGCKFYPRCNKCRSVCEKKEPNLVKVGPMHYVACHFC